MQRKLLKDLGPHLMLLLVLTHRTECMLLCFHPVKHLETKIKACVNWIAIYRSLYVTENKQTQWFGGQIMAPDFLS